MSVLHRALGCLFLVGSGLSLLAIGCGAEQPDDLAPEDGGEYGNLSEEISSTKTVGDWAKFPNGQQCLAAVQMFYPAKFGVHLPLAGSAWKGDCAPHGACHIWLDQIPSSADWERIPNDGKHLPTTYDVIVYPPHGSNPWGHIASVDHVEGKTIYVIDDNYVGHLQKASHPHTVSTTPYGWYHLKKLGSSGGSSSNDCVAGGLYCGGDKITGDANTLYECNANGSVSKVEACSRGCAVRSGRDDACRTCVVGGLYCGGDKLDGNANTLYKCNTEGFGTVVKVCSKGCSVNSGTDDSCK